MTNPVVDRAMRAAFRAWQDEMVRTGKTSALNARFDDIAARDRRLIELQCRAAIASLREPTEQMIEVMPGYSDDVIASWRLGIDAALKDG